MVPNHEKKRDYYVFIQIDKRTLILKNGQKKRFLMNQSNNVIYPKEENEFMIHNHEKKRDYYMNPCLSKLTNEL